jgi:hypothetical protein
VVESVSREFVVLAVILIALVFQPAPQARKLRIPGGPAKVNLPLQSGPRPGDHLIDFIECGQDITVLEEETGHTGWLKIKTKMAVEGYLQAGFLKEQKPVSDPQQKGIASMAETPRHQAQARRRCPGSTGPTRMERKSTWLAMGPRKSLSFLSRSPRKLLGLANAARPLRS